MPTQKGSLQASTSFLVSGTFTDDSDMKLFVATGADVSILLRHVREPSFIKTHI
jgi:hypothetical protein